MENGINAQSSPTEEWVPVDVTGQEPPKRRGRKPGSKNKVKAATPAKPRVRVSPQAPQATLAHAAPTRRRGRPAVAAKNTPKHGSLLGELIQLIGRHIAA